MFSERNKSCHSWQPSSGGAERPALCYRINHMTSIISNEAVPAKYELAAQRLIEEVVKDYINLSAHAKKLREFMAEWRRTMSAFRGAEKRYCILAVPSPDGAEAHKRAMNAMILCADTLTNSLQRYIEVNYHLENAERAAFGSEIELLKRHRTILAFDFKSWHGMPQDNLEAAAHKFFGESRSKAA